MLVRATPSSRHGTATATAAANPPFTNVRLSNDHLRFVFTTALQLLVLGIVTYENTFVVRLPAKAADLHRQLSEYGCPVWLPTSPTAITDIMGPLAHFSTLSTRHSQSSLHTPSLPVHPPLRIAELRNECRITSMRRTRASFFNGELKRAI